MTIYTGYSCLLKSINWLETKYLNYTIGKKKKKNWSQKLVNLNLEGCIHTGLRRIFLDFKIRYIQFGSYIIQNVKAFNQYLEESFRNIVKNPAIFT